MPNSIDNKTDREILVMQSITLKKLCDTVTTLSKANKEEHKDIIEKVDVVVEGKVSNRLFFWVTGFIILFIMTLASFTGIVKVDVTKNTANIEHLEKESNDDSGS